MVGLTDIERAFLDHKTLYENDPAAFYVAVFKGTAETLRLNGVSERDIRGVALAMEMAFRAGQAVAGKPSPPW